MQKQIDKGILYLCIHKKIKERIGMSRIITKDALFRIFGETFHVPKNMRMCVMQEMINKKLIEEDGNSKKKYLKVLSADIDIDNDTHKIYKIVGLH